MEKRSLYSCLISGPKTLPELLRESGLARRSLRRELGRMARLGILMVFPLWEGGRWETLYALPGHSELAARRCGFQRLSGAVSALAALEVGRGGLRRRRHASVGGEAAAVR
ncbi:MAG: hypothetical protein HY558_03370 [Euryarchaeota archaeon]|nr:hypothetical protein [Euryarchaeota archaeon]